MENRNIKSKRKPCKLILNSWDAQLIADLLDYEIGNTDGWSAKEYARMTVLKNNLQKISSNLYKEELEEMK